TEDYHERRYEEVLRNQEVIDVLNRYQFDVNQFLELEQYQLLEYPLPGLCADRIDYTLRDLFQLDMVSKAEITWFLDGLQIYDGRIALKSRIYGEWFQSKYAFLVSAYFGGKENVEANLAMKKIIKDSMEKGIIVESDFFEDDFYLIEKINAHFDLKKRIERIRAGALDKQKLKTKKRSVDPEILMNNKVFKLSELQ
ncbi:MAG: phosphohydrolase, partial [Bacteroidota bacterium]